MIQNGFNSSSQPKISVIIPVYNVEEYIRECLESVLNQTLKDIEIICVDDGSTDKSLSILYEYAERDERFKILTQKNQGAAVARNAALDSACGEFICFMDSDDWYPETDVLETLYSSAIKNNVIICGGSLAKYKPDGTVQTNFPGVNAKCSFDHDGLVFYRNYQYDYFYQRFIYKRDFLNQHNLRFPLYRRFQDPPFFVTAMIYAQKFYAISKITYAYRIGSYSRVVWTEEKLSHLCMGVTDLLNISREQRLSDLHDIAINHITRAYLELFENQLPQASGEFIDLLKKLAHSIDAELLSPDSLAKGYDTCLHKMLNKAGIACYSSGISPDLSNTEQPLVNEYLKNNLRIAKRDTESCSSQPLVTIIIPIYKVEEYLADCISSVVDQTYNNIEILCVNDGSPDRSRDIAEEFKQYDSRIVLLDKENGGLASARNFGIKNAHGKYILFLDSDDYLEHNAISELVALAEEAQTDVIDFDAIAFFESNTAYKNNKSYKKYYIRNGSYSEIYENGNLLVDFISNDDFKPSACLHFIRKDFLTENSIYFHDGIIHEDNPFSVILLALASRSIYHPAAYYNRRVHENSIMSSEKSFRNLEGYFITTVDLLDFVDTHELSEDVKAAIRLFLASLRNSIYSLHSLLVEQDPDFDVVSSFKSSKLQFLYQYLVIDQLIPSKVAAENLRTAKKENKKLKSKNKKLKSSVSYKIGRLITFVPRKIRNRK